MENGSDPRKAKEITERLDAIWNYLPAETDPEDWQPSREEFLALITDWGQEDAAVTTWIGRRWVERLDPK